MLVPPAAPFSSFGEGFPAFHAKAAARRAVQMLRPP